MSRARIHMDSRADHNALMARLCEQAAVGLAHQIAMTSDPKKREAIRRRIQEHELQSEMHRRIVNELQCAE